MLTDKILSMLMPANTYMLFALWHVQFTICLLFTLCRALGRPFEWWLATRRYNRINNVEKKKLVPFATSCVIWEDLNIIVGFPRYFHDVSMIFLWDYYLNSYGISFVVPMLFHVIFMIFLWAFCEIPMGFP
jgi:hypothetical protein